MNEKSQVFIESLSDKITKNGAGHIQAIFIGGSTMKGISDQHSDLELGLVLDTIEQAAFICDFDEYIDSCSNYCGPSYFLAADEIFVEIKLSSTEFLHQQLLRFNQDSDCDLELHDFLFNIKHGDYLYCTDAHRAMIEQVVMTELHQRKLIASALAEIKDYGFSIYEQRLDHYPYYVCLTTIHAAYMRIVFALNKQLHMGFKQFSKLAKAHDLTHPGLQRKFELAYTNLNASLVFEIIDDIFDFVKSLTEQNNLELEIVKPEFYYRYS